MSLQEAPALTRTLPRATTATATLRDLFIVTWAVPDAAVRPRVPEALTLDRLPSASGEPHAFVQLVFALRDAARWSPLPAKLGEDYHEATLQVLTRTGAERSAFVLKHYTSSSRIASTLYPFTPVAEEARFQVYVAGDPARQTFEKLAIKITTDAVQVHLRAEAGQEPQATPLGRWSDAVAFLAERGSALYPARLPKGAITVFRSEHAPLVPCTAALTHCVLRPFDDLELGEPVLALYQAELVVSTQAPKRQR